MGYVRLRDDVIRSSHIEGDNTLRDRINALPGGAKIELEVARSFNLRDDHDRNPLVPAE